MLMMASFCVKTMTYSSNKDMSNTSSYDSGSS